MNQVEVCTVDVLIVCALKVEAKPLIEHFNLHFLQGQYGFKLYGEKQLNPKKTLSNSLSNCSPDKNSLRILITGVGKVNMAAAMMWSQQFCKPKSCINVGFAGHGSHAVGDTMLINQVFENSSKISFYPSINFRWKGHFSSLKTLEVPSDNYCSEYAFDMEASAFFDIAHRFITNDKIQVLKVISDNSEQPFNRMTKQSMQDCMKALLLDLEILINSMRFEQRHSVYDAGALIEEMQKKWHVTAARAIQLKDRYEAVIVMEENVGISGPDWKKFDNASSYLKQCQEWLNNVKPKLK